MAEISSRCLAEVTDSGGSCSERFRKDEGRGRATGDRKGDNMRLHLGSWETDSVIRQ